MRIEYVASVMQEKDFKKLFQGTNSMPGQQAQKYHRLMIEGLELNDCFIEVIAGVPITKNNYPHKFYSGSENLNGKVLYHYLSTINFPILKTFMQMIGGFFSILKLKKKDRPLIVCDVLNASVSLGAIIASKIRRFPCLGIVTDLPNLMVTGGKPNYIRIVNLNIKKCSGYVLLTEQMNKIINANGKPYVIIEGLSDLKMQKQAYSSTSNNNECIYAGILDERYGVKKMVEAFIKANVPGFQLHIYGSGPYSVELKEIVKLHNNIFFHGNVFNDEVMQAEMKAKLLINPRPSCEEFTKYSFPSKNMEYMSSGTPVLTTKLPGMPIDYYQYIYLFEDESVEGMAETFKKILTTEDNELIQKGQLAKKFVLTKKNNKIQSSKLISLGDKYYGKP